MSIPPSIARDPESFLGGEDPAIRPSQAAKAALALARRGALDERRASAFGRAFALAVDRHAASGASDDPWDAWRPAGPKAPPMDVEWALHGLDQILGAGPARLRAAAASGLECSGAHAGFGLCGLWMARALRSDDQAELRGLLGAGADPFGLAISGLHPLDAAWLFDARACAGPLAAAAMRVELPWQGRWVQGPLDWSSLIAAAPPMMSTRLWSGALAGGCSLASRAPVLARSWERAAPPADGLAALGRFASFLGRPARLVEGFERTLPPMGEQEAMDRWGSMAASASAPASGAADSGLFAWLEAVQIEAAARRPPADAGSGLRRLRI